MWREVSGLCIYVYLLYFLLLIFVIILSKEIKQYILLHSQNIVFVLYKNINEMSLQWYGTVKFVKIVSFSQFPGLVR